ncbi:MAG: RNA pseudouridine synthase, partial [Myxococcota bacterium]
EKTYVALAQGRLRRKETIDGPIARARGTRHEVSSEGKPALTEVWPLAHGSGTTLVACRPHSGRTHQIRVHLAHLGHPILGDRLYGGPGYTGDSPATPIARPMLHALRLRVAHPRSGTALTIECAPPVDFETLGRALGAWREGDWGIGSA